MAYRLWLRMKKPKCPQCQKNESQQDAEYGILPCFSCQDDNASLVKPTQKSTFDFASPITKLHRKEYYQSMLQPYTGDGILSREFVEAHGVDKLQGVGKKEIKNAKYVYSNMTRHHKIRDSKK